MKKNKAMRLAVGLLVAVILTIGMVSGAMAKYVSGVDFGGDASGSSSAKIAKWEVELNGKNIETAADEIKEMNFNLFATIYDTKTEAGKDLSYSDGKVNNGEKDQDVADNRVAPGTTGAAGYGTAGDIKYDIKITNKSEVNVRWYFQVELTFAAGGAIELPLEFSTNGTDWYSAAEFKTATSNGGVINMNSDTTTGNSFSGNIYWRWLFEAEEVEAEEVTDNDIWEKLQSDGTCEGEDSCCNDASEAKTTHQDEWEETEAVLKQAAQDAADAATAAAKKARDILDTKLGTEAGLASTQGGITFTVRLIVEQID